MYKSETATNGTQTSATFSRVSEDEGYFSLSDLAQVILRRLWVILLVVFLVVGAAVGASLWQTPTYEASSEVWVDQQLGQQGKNLAGSVEGLQSLMPTLIHVIDSRPVAEDATQQLSFEMTPEELLSNLTIEHVEGTNFIHLTYEGTNLAEAAQIVNTVGEVSSERISETTRAAGSDLSANVFVKARVPDNPTPVSPNPLRNGLLTLVIGLMLSAVTVVALPGVGARVAGTLGERPNCQGVRQAGVLGRRHRDHSIVERIKEKKLLLALGRRGKLTAVEAALETSLSVGEAHRMLQALAARGHLEVTVEYGRLLYSFWDLAEEEGQPE